MAVAIRVREARRAAGPFTWLHAFRHYAFNSIASDVHPGRGGGTRTPADAVLETAALAAELHLFRKPPNKKAASVYPGRLADLGVSSVVSRHRQAHLAAREGIEHRAAQPMLAAVFGERWAVHHDHHGGELLRASLREVNRNQREQ